MNSTGYLSTLRERKRPSIVHELWFKLYKFSITGATSSTLILLAEQIKKEEKPQIFQQIQ